MKRKAIMNWNLVLAGLTALVAVGAVIAGYGAVRQRLISHEELDHERFATVTTLLNEVRGDVKTLITMTPAPRKRRAR